MIGVFSIYCIELISPRQCCNNMTISIDDSMSSFQFHRIGLGHDTDLLFHVDADMGVHH